MSVHTETATLGGGCFWCLEALYQTVKGVSKVVSGYAGGEVDNPSYQAVCDGTTGHAEVVQLTFDPSVISYNDILYIFWRIHDPTTLNRQGNDAGTQYRSVILYHNDTQRLLAEKSLLEADASPLWPGPVVTELAAAGSFYAAEDYHQDYYLNNPRQPYCSMVIDPKVQKFRESFTEMLRPAND
ncbi:MAG: peptide-methionine (S)-S-oxide reductase MsrA [Candidatus Latescibacteria bacterium]|nr:peptide-methionine (S)-S-oxide reductase MsrA [Candidatus Latescibacterota bacterium]